MSIRVFKSTAFSPIAPSRVRLTGFDYRAFPVDRLQAPDPVGPIVDVDADILIVGGGAGGATAGGGGGQVIELFSVTLDQPNYPIVIGAGGLGRLMTVEGLPGFNGESSSGFGQTAIGGGGGGNTSNLGAANGAQGASGGGGGGSDVNTTLGGVGTAGFDGGGNAGFADSPYPAGGGGGADAAGHDAPSAQVAGAGGAGLFSDISGASYGYGAGGGGGGFGSLFIPLTFGAGGLSGGGSSSAGAPNSGGGGGGNNALGSNGGATGFAGGSGVVIVRYFGSPRFSGGVVTTVGTDTVHTFTSSGSLTLL